MLRRSEPEEVCCARTREFDVHGIVGVRMAHVRPDHGAAVESLLAGFEQPLVRNPDVVLRFVERLEVPRLHLVGSDGPGLDEDGFLYLRDADSRFKVKAGFERLGRGGELICERGMIATAWFVDILKQTAVRKGIAPVDAAGVVLNGAGILMPAPADSGWAPALDGLLKMGARYLGEALLFERSGGRLCGLPAPRERTTGFPASGVALSAASAARVERVFLLSRRSSTRIQICPASPEEIATCLLPLPARGDERDGPFCPGRRNLFAAIGPGPAGWRAVAREILLRALEGMDLFLAHVPQAFDFACLQAVLEPYCARPSSAPQIGIFRTVKVTERQVSFEPDEVGIVPRAAEPAHQDVLTTDGGG